MKRPKLHAALALVCLSTQLSGCACVGESTRRAAPRLELVGDVADGFGVIHPGDRYAVDFGRLAVGRSVEVRLTVRNTGLVTLDAETSVEGDLQGWFLVHPASIVVPPGSIQELALRLSPEDAGEAEATLVVTSNDPERPRVEVLLRGEGLEPEFEVSPRALDFGKVVLDTGRALEVEVTNLSSEPLVVDVGDVAPESDAPHFDVALPDVPGRLEIPAEGSARLQVVYRPAGIGTHSGSFTLEACPSCAALTVELTGEGIATGLQVEPDALDFGYAHPDRPLTKEVTFRNVGNVPVTVTEVGLAGPSGSGSADAAFNIETPALPLELPPEAEVPVPIKFTPPDLTSHIASLVWRAPETAVPSGVILLLGEGGGPAITVSPEALDFGLTALGVPRERTLQISNEGHHPLTLQGHELVDSATFEVVADPPETVLAPLETAEWVIRYAPDSDGAELSTLRILSDDPYHPETAVALKGEGIALPACTYSISPEPLDFGTVARTHTLTLAIDVRNESEHEICLAGPFRLSEDTPPDFTLVDAGEDGALPRMLLDPGERVRTKVAFRPGTWGQFGGELVFEISDPGSPEGRVALTGASASSSITVSPPVLDFGEVEAPCHHARRVFCVTNNGSEGAIITSLAVADGPDAGNFALVELPSSLARSEGVELPGGTDRCFAVHFVPTEGGEYLGAVRVDLDVDGHADGQQLAVGLTGSGATGDRQALGPAEGCYHGQVSPRQFPCTVVGSPAFLYDTVVFATIYDEGGNSVLSIFIEIDADGYFSLPPLPSGRYRLLLQYDAHTLQIHVEVVDGAVSVRSLLIAPYSNRIAYFQGSYDRIQDVLVRVMPAGVPEGVQLGLLNDLDGLRTYGALFMNCGVSLMPAHDAEVIDNLREFVEGGGGLYLSDGASLYLRQAWPGVIDPPAYGVIDDGPWIEGALNSPEMRDLLGADSLPLYFGDRSVHFTMDESSSLVPAAMISGTMGDAPDTPITVCFRYGNGYVFYTSMHHDVQPSATIDPLMLHILKGVLLRE